MSNIEKRIERLEHLLRGPRAMAVVIQQEDGTWPPDPAGAALIVQIRRFSIDGDSDAA